jgi:large subunit ribosomal protein L18
MSTERKIKNRSKRIMHIRKSISGTALRPRISVFRSNKHIYAQAINDEQGVTIATISNYSLKNKSKNNIDSAKEVGQELGKVLAGKNIAEAVFDRRGYKYHGKVKALADGIREAGLKM